ncbi:MAG: hypothetical protein LRY40_08750 [Shewanella fodinae]|nr:hypothetical protein [Shewanella fodinae]
MILSSNEHTTLLRLVKHSLYASALRQTAAAMLTAMQRLSLTPVSNSHPGHSVMLFCKATANAFKTPAIF